MSNYNRITFKERVRIEAGIYAKKSFSQIAKEIGRSTSSVTREVKQNRIMVKTPYSYGTDCIYPPSCRKTGLCGDEYCSNAWIYYFDECFAYDEDYLINIASGDNRTLRWCKIVEDFKLDTLNLRNGKMQEMLVNAKKQDKANVKAYVISLLKKINKY